MPDNEMSRQEVHHHHCCCAGVSTRGGRLFWGAALVILGGLWLLTNLDLIPVRWWELVGPALIIAWGVTIWLRVKSAG
jgi:hypothetical protein